MKKVAKIFSPDAIATQISQAVSRDLLPLTHEYGGERDSLSLLAHRQVTEFDKKYVNPLDKDETRSVDAYLKFLFVVDHMRSVEEGFSVPSLDIERPQSRDDKYTRILKRARLLMHSVLTPLSQDEWFHACQHGTGTSIGVSYQDTSLEAKSRLPWTVTKRVVSLLDAYQDFDSQLKSAVIAYNSEVPIGTWYTIVEGSRATTVPKTRSIDRLIAVEPTGNMFLQQGLMACLYDRMKSVGLDLASLPDMHRERARISSITSQEATIDWSSASDCVSRELLRWLLPPIWFERCDMVRSPFTQIDGDWIELPMYATMGNAVTFPLETLVLWTLGHATLLDGHTLSSYPEWDDLLKVSVFGDDCIVPSHIAEDFIEVCQHVGFIINKEKSFYDDKGFRESCGGDFLRGYDVRPFHLKGPTSARLSALEPWLYIVGNRLLPKYMSCFGTRNYVYAKELWSCLFSLFNQYGLELKIVPNEYPDDAGLKLGNDLQRFIDNYPGLVLSRISINQHGTYSFLYCRFRYWQEKNKFGDLRFWQWMKQVHGWSSVSASRLSYLDRRSTISKQDHMYRIRRRGGYVVAKGKTAHWTVVIRI